MEVNHLNWYNTKLREFLTPDEVKAVMQKSDLRAALEVLSMWLWIAFAFALVGFYPNVFTVIIALFILGGKQLACAILLHDYYKTWSSIAHITASIICIPASTMTRT